MASDPHKFTRDHFSEVMSRLRDNAGELDRLRGVISDRHMRTLRKDVEGGWEKRQPGRKVDPDYMQGVCNAVLNRFTSPLYNSIANVVVEDLESQKSLNSMVGKYNAYWPSNEPNTFSTWPMEIEQSDGMYTVRSITGDEQYQYSHMGFAFKIRHRVHVIDARRNGLRTMLFHFEPYPARHAVRGIILNVLRTESDALHGEQLYAAHFLAIHQSNERYNQKIPNEDVARMLEHPRNRTGVVRA